MPKKRNKKNKLAQHKGVIVLLILLAIAAAGSWFLISEQNKTEPADKLAGQAKTPDVANKTFQSSTLGLKFSYPKQWTVSQGFDNQSGLGEKTSLKIKSPNGLVIRVEPRYMGPKDGETCQNNIYDKPHNTLSCSTIEVFSKQKVELSSTQGEVYLIKALHTGPRPPGSSSPPKSHNLLLLSSDPKLNGSSRPLVGKWSKVGSVLSPTGYLSFYLEGIDATTEDFYTSKDVAEAGQILSSFRDYYTVNP